MITLHVDLESQDNGKQNLRSLTFKKKNLQSILFLSRTRSRAKIADGDSDRERQRQWEPPQRKCSGAGAHRTLAAGKAGASSSLSCRAALEKRPHSGVRRGRSRGTDRPYLHPKSTDGERRAAMSLEKSAAGAAPPPLWTWTMDHGVIASDYHDELSRATCIPGSVQD